MEKDYHDATTKSQVWAKLTSDNVEGTKYNRFDLDARGSINDASDL